MRLSDVSTVIRRAIVLLVVLCAFGFSATAQTDTTDEPARYRFTSMITGHIGASMVAGRLYDRTDISGGVSFGGTVRARAYRRVYIGYLYLNQVQDRDLAPLTFNDFGVDVTVVSDVRQHEFFALVGLMSNPAHTKSPFYFGELGAGVVTQTYSYDYTPDRREDYSEFDGRFGARIAGGIVLPLSPVWGVQFEGSSRWVCDGLDDLGAGGWNHGFTVGLAYMVGGR